MQGSAAALPSVRSRWVRRCGHGLTIARNVVVDDAKSARWKIGIPLPEHFDGAANVTDPETAVVIRELADEVQSLLPDLSSDQRACVELRFLADPTVPEVARRMNRDHARYQRTSSAPCGRVNGT